MEAGVPERGLGIGAAVIIVVLSVIILIPGGLWKFVLAGPTDQHWHGRLARRRPTARDPSRHQNQVGDIHQRSWRAAGPFDD